MGPGTAKAALSALSRLSRSPLSGLSRISRKRVSVEAGEEVEGADERRQQCLIYDFILSDPKNTVVAHASFDSAGRLLSS